MKVSQQQVLAEVHELVRTLTQHLTMADKQQELAALLQESHQYVDTDYTVYSIIMPFSGAWW